MARKDGSYANNGKHPNSLANLSKPFTGSDDPRTKKALEVVRKKGERTRKHKELTAELRDMKSDAVAKAKDRVASGLMLDPLDIIMNGIMDCEIMLANPDLDDSAQEKWMSLKLKYTKEYAALTIGNTNIGAIHSEVKKEEMTPEEVEAKLLKFTSIQGGKKD